MKKFLILIPSTILAYNRPGGFANNFNEGFKASLVDLIDALYGIFFIMGLIILAYSIYSIFLDDNPQKRGVGNIFWDMFIFSIGLMLILIKPFIHWLTGIPL